MLEKIINSGVHIALLFIMNLNKMSIGMGVNADNDKTRFVNNSVKTNVLN